MRFAVRALLGFAFLLTASQVHVVAAVVSEDVPVLGGTAAVARGLLFDPAPEPARFVAELARLIYDVPEEKSGGTASKLERLRTHLEVVGRFQSALDAVQPKVGGIALAMAIQKNDRNRLKTFLDLLDLKLREEKKVFSVEPAKNTNKESAARVGLLSDLGVDVKQLTLRLNRGETVRVEVPVDLVPVPLTAEIWGRVVFGKSVNAGGLFAAIMADRQAALVCHGLAALDDDTLQFIAEHPEMLKRLYEHDAPAFAAFASSLRIHGGRVVPPGGDPAVPLWEAVLGEPATNPDRFVRELFGKADGRIAFLYDTLAGLDPSTNVFALGLWIKDATLRTERFKEFVSTTNGAYDDWHIVEGPFGRPSSDIVALLTRMHVDDRGAPVLGPRLLWSRAFESLDLPDEPARQLKDLAEDGLIDAAWLAQATLAYDRKTRSERLDQLAFGQRVFGSADEWALPDVLVALRAFPRYRMLMLTLERMGIRTPAVYVAAARQAVRLSALDANRGFVALAQVQSALALLTRMVAVRTLDTAKAEALVSSLVALPLTGDGRYMGAVAWWVQVKLVPALPRADSLEGGILVALAGTPSGDDVRTRPVSWEGQQYRLDLAGVELRRLERVREKQGGYPVDLAAQLDDTAVTLAADWVTLDDIRAAAGTLKTLVGALTPKKAKKSAPAVLPPGVDPPRDSRQIVERAVQDLSKINKPNDARKANGIAAGLFELTDGLLADVLLSIAYAVDLGDPDGATLLGGNVAPRHDFGFAKADGEQRLRAPWSVPGQVAAQGMPWRVTGSALGLDVALASLALRRVATDAPIVAPALLSNEQDTFAGSVALMNPRALRDADRDAIAEAVDRGRAVVAALAEGSAADTLANTVGMDGWRRRALAWTVAHDRARTASLFSMTDLLYLGGAPATSLDGWGMMALASSGCLCERLAPPGRWRLSTGRSSQPGLLATTVADLHLRVAVVLHELDLPAALMKPVLAAAVDDFIHEARPTDPNDWLTLVRAAQAVGRERIEDYVSAVAADGPLALEGAQADRQPGGNR